VSADDRLLLLRVKYLEKVVERALLNKSNMAKNKDNKPPVADDTSAAGVTTPQSPGDGTSDTDQSSQQPPVTPPQVEAEAIERDWALRYKSTSVRSPKTGKLIEVDASKLDEDPELLAWMLTKHPDAFSQLPAPKEAPAADTQ